MTYSLRILKIEHDNLIEEKNRIINCCKELGYLKLEPINGSAINEIESRLKDLLSSMELISKQL
jgi:hypothetical protein